MKKFTIKGNFFRSYIEGPLNLNKKLTIAFFFAFVHLIIGILINRGELGFSAMTFGEIADASSISNGSSIFSLWPGQPFGYSILIWITSKIIPDVIYSAALVILISRIISIALFFLICTEILSLAWSIAATVFLIFQFQFLSHLLYLWVEGPFIASELAFVYFLLKFKTSNYNQKFLFASGLAGSLMFNIRYIAGCYILFFGIYALYKFFQKKLSFKGLLIAGSISLLIIAPVLYRNFILTNTLAGHPIGLQPAYNFIQAFRELIIQTGIFSFIPFPGKFWHFGHAFTIPLIAFVVFITICPLFLSKLKNKSGFIWLMMPLYIVAFAYAESSTRLDIINFRFIYPIIPFFSLHLFSILEFYYLEFKSSRLAIKFLITLIILSTLTTTAILLVKGSRPSNFNYSPELLNKIKNLNPTPKTIIINRYGDQLGMHFPDIQRIAIPYTDKANGDYMAIYGMKAWSREDFIKTVKDNNINIIAFFLGRNHTDPFLDQNEYGTFIKSLFLGQDPIVIKREETSDGVLIWIKTS
jgi:hypothetical protein